MKKIISVLLAAAVIFSTAVFSCAEVGTSLQHPGSFDDSIYVPVDTCMFYTTDPSSYGRCVKSLPENTSPSMMIAINRATQSDIDNHDTIDSTMIQQRSNGSYITHPTGASYYMVPTTELAELFAAQLVECVKVKKPYMIALEEPEMWTEGGYSEAFKKAWAEYYGTPWQDPNENAENFYKACELRIEMFKKAIELISLQVKAASPETKIIIATHSTQNYKHYKIASGVAIYAAMDCVDGIIGQTWSDTIFQPFTYRSEQVVDPFGYGFLEYSTYIDAIKDKMFFALADPAADNASFTWETNMQNYKSSLAAQLCVPQIDKFEIAPWPSRAFSAAPLEYKTIQLNMFRASQLMANTEGTLNASSQGISIGFSDTFSWQSDKFTGDAEGMLMAVAYELCSNGIPVTYTCLDRLTSAADLKDVKLLVLSYEIMKPLTKEDNEIIAQWVKEGGKLLYIGGSDPLSKSKNMHYSEYGSPLGELINKLGLNIALSCPAITSSQSVSSTLFDYGITFSKSFSEKFYAIDGTGFEKTISAGSYTVGAKATVQNGELYLYTLPMTALTGRNGNKLVTDLIENALEKPLVKETAFICERNNYTAVHAFSKTTLQGKYINLFDKALSVSENPVIEAGTDEVFIKLTEATDTPLLFFSNGQREENLVQTKEQTSLTLFGPINALTSAVFVCPKGMYPQSVTAKGVSPIINWDEKNSALTVSVATYSKGTEISVEWGNKRTNLTDKPTYSVLTIATNENNLDKDYIFSNNTGANSAVRFADLDTQLVYKFDLDGLAAPVFSFCVAQNYILEVSSNNETYTVVEDYRDIDPIRIQNSSNSKYIQIDPAAYGINETMYVRLRNTDTTKGMGGTISSFSISSFSPDETIYYGDINADKLITLVDAMKVFFHIAGKAEITDKKALTNIDVDKDGEVTVTDAIKIFRAVAGKEAL